MTPSATASDRELVFTRLIDAPPQLVYEAWTNPARVGQWWGPRGFTTTTQSMDVRPGGEWRFVMHGPDGVDYKNLIVYHEAVRGERLVYRHGAERVGEPGEFRVTLTFEDQGGKTRLTMHAVWASAEELEKVKPFGVVEGGKQTLERLAEFVAERKG